MSYLQVFAVLSALERVRCRGFMCLRVIEEKNNRSVNILLCLTIVTVVQLYTVACKSSLNILLIFVEVKNK